MSFDCYNAINGIGWFGGIFSILIFSLFFYFGFLLYNVLVTYHVLQPRVTIKWVVRPYFLCKRHDSQPECPIMSPLPASRIETHQWPLTHVGIDYFGKPLVSMLGSDTKWCLRVWIVEPSTLNLRILWTLIHSWRLSSVLQTIVEFPLSVKAITALF